MSETKVTPTTVGPTLSKQTIFNFALLFSMTRSAVNRMLNNQTTNKTDKIIFNSVSKAIERHMEEK
jgi:hypothetical protein